MWVLYIFWRSNPCLRYHWQICLSIQLVLFHFTAVFFSHAEAFYFDEIPFVYSFLMSLALGDISLKILLREISEIFLPMFSSRTLKVSGLIFKFFIHLEFIFVYGVSWWSSFLFFFFFACSYPALPTPFVEEAIFTSFYAPSLFASFYTAALFVEY